jgi:hypothetical protein
MSTGFDDEIVAFDIQPPTRSSLGLGAIPLRAGNFSRLSS